MDVKIQKVLDIWHKHFEDEDRQYSEFESSDIEYFVACILYNHFNFSKALETMKTMDLSYDFLSECGDEYDEIKSIINSIELDGEILKLEFLLSFIQEAKAKYTKNELYLLDRMQKHIFDMADRYEHNIEAKKIEFTSPSKEFVNPLLR